jgi:DNA modification methylase
MNNIEFGDCRATMRRWKEQGIKAQTCVTSPPYYGLRDYGTAKWEDGDVDCEHSISMPTKWNDPKRGTSVLRPETAHRGGTSTHCHKCGATRVDSQLGLEETPEEYIKAMVEVFRCVWDVLEDDGTLWLNIGDSYARNGGGVESKMNTVHKMGVGQKATYLAGGMQSINKVPDGLKSKDLIGIPWMMAFALRADGWYLRQDIIWHKPNPMPESVQDRCTKAHEYIFLMSKSQKYYYDAEAIAEPAQYWGERDRTDGKYHNEGTGLNPHRGLTGVKADPRAGKGRIAYEGKRTEGNISGGQESFVSISETRNKRSVWTVTTKPYAGAHFAVFPSDLIEPCILAGAPVGGVVLDPFMGSGTTGQVAQNLGRQYIGCELNIDYKPLQDKRLAQQSLILE